VVRSRDAVVSEALLLRDWALRVLSAPGSRLPVEVPQWCGLGGWTLMLNSEKCALPIRAVFCSAPASFAERTCEIIDFAASRELYRVLLARQQCSEIEALAATRGWSLAVMKGGRAAISPSGHVDLADVDLLAHPDCLMDVRAGLLELGYRETGKAGSYRTPKLVRDGALPIELHFAIPLFQHGGDVWSRVRPLPGHAGFTDLDASDRLWHLLVHCTLQHPNRRGRLRDLCLLREAVLSCTSAGLAEVHGRASQHECAQPILALLGMAEAVVKETVPTDPFRVTAASSYLWTHGIAPLPLSASLKRQVRIGVFYQLGGCATEKLRWHWTGQRSGLELPSRFRAMRSLQRLWPSMGKRVRWVLRSFAINASLPVTLLLVARARRAVAEVERLEEGALCPTKRAPL